MENDSIYNSRIATFKTEVLKVGSVDKVSMANFVPGNEIKGKATGYVRKVGANEAQAGSFAFSAIDFDFISNFNVEIIAGRGFDEKYASDLVFGEAIIINKKACDLLGFNSPQQAIGEKIEYRINSQPTIIGVIDNFHQYSMDMAYQPIIFEGRKDPQSYYYLKLTDGMDQSQLLNLKLLWTELFPGNPFNYFYLDQYYNQQYRRDELFMKAFSLFSVLTMIVATMGFFGLIYYTAVSKIQEIGIRIILGAGKLDVCVLLSQGLLFYIGAATIISLPLMYYISSKLLLSYAFKIDLVWWMFAFPVLILIIISVIVVLIQSLRSYSINPSITLKEN
jgi:putative ABC transport system permease protein